MDGGNMAAHRVHTGVHEEGGQGAALPRTSTEVDPDGLSPMGYYPRHAVFVSP